MVNALNELNIYTTICKDAKIKWAVIKHIPTSGNSKTILLKEGYSDSEYSDFEKKMNFEYDGGYGTQELFGMVMFTNDTWLERDEYDGKEWWNYKSYPYFEKAVDEIEDWVSLVIKEREKL